MHILLIEDSQRLRSSITRGLEKEGFWVNTSDNGRDGLALAQEGTYEAIILDLMLPGLNGFTVLERLRQNGSQIPILILSARCQLGYKLRGLDQGADDYLVKPFSFKELVSRLRVLIRRKRAGERQIHRLRERNEALRRSRDQMVASKKLAYLNMLSSGIAHQLKNPLNFVNNFSALAAEMMDELILDFHNPTSGQSAEKMKATFEALRVSLHSIEKNGVRANHIIDNMIKLSHTGIGGWTSQDLNRLILETAQACAGNHSGGRARAMPAFKLDPEAGDCLVQPQNFAQALAALINNGIEALLEKAHDADADFEPTLLIVTERAGDRQRILIRDNGSGISPRHLEHIFTPFFTTKPPDSGHLGLGLPLAYEILVGEHQGDLFVKSTPTTTEFVMSLSIEPRARFESMAR